MRMPSAALIVDANVLIAAVYGRRRAPIFAVQATTALMTTERAVEEARRRVELGLKRPDLLSTLDELVGEMTVVPMASLEPALDNCEIALREAVQSRNGSVKDAHLLALAWAVSADIWSSDRDFAGTGVASWSTINLVRALAETQS